MTKKKIAAAMERNAIGALKKAPYVNVLSLIVNVSSEKSGSPKIAAIRGVSRFSTIDVITALKAAPITTAIANSTMFPLVRNSLSSRKMPGIATPPPVPELRSTFRYAPPTSDGAGVHARNARL